MKRLATILILALMSTALFAQNITVKGTVVDDQGLPQISASVFQKGTTNGTVTDFDGNYTISVPADAVLVFNYFGFLEAEEPVGGRTTINVAMQPDNLGNLSNEFA